MGSKTEFEYQQKPKFNIGDDVLIVVSVNEVSGTATSLVFKGRISWLRITVDIEPVLNSNSNKQTQTYSYMYYVENVNDDTDEWLSYGNNLFSLNATDKAQTLAKKYLKEAKEKNDAKAELLARLRQ